MSQAEISQIAGAILGATVAIVVMTIIRLYRAEY